LLFAEARIVFTRVTQGVWESRSLQTTHSLFLDGHGSSVVAKSIRASRAIVRKRLLANAAPDRTPTVLLDVLAESLIDHCAEAAARGNMDALLDWAETTCRTRIDAPAIRSLFLSVGSALTQTVGENGFAALSDRLKPLVQQLRAPTAGASNDTVDELDLVLAEMVSRVESNDPMTAEHCRAVSAWCGRIAQRLSLSRTEATFVARGGLIHDVGKSLTPHEILLAPRPLTDSEWIVMRDHVVAGYGIVQDHHQLRDFAGVVRSHHERFEGGGYPDNLDRARIPMAVRIVTVADAFNAMIGRRPYRTPLSPDRATFELRRHAGTQFDPNVVAALIDVIGGGHEKPLTLGAVAC
jgi:putative nucleotidyltransferase with HDIG domain